MDEESVKSTTGRKRSRKKSNTTDNSPLLNFSFLTTLFLIVVAVLLYDVIRFSNNETDSIGSIKNELLNSVHNQSEAISVLTHTLEDFFVHNKKRVINFIGTTGVGKTFTANVLTKYFDSSNAVTKVDFNVINSIKLGVRNLLVLDDLNINDLDVLIKFLKQISVDVPVFIICIFNIQESNDLLNYRVNNDVIKNVSEKFELAQLNFTMAKFKQFTLDEVKTWLVNQVETRGLTTESAIKSIDFLLSHQNIAFHGLKGLSSKLNIEFLNYKLSHFNYPLVL